MRQRRNPHRIADPTAVERDRARRHRHPVAVRVARRHRVGERQRRRPRARRVPGRAHVRPHLDVERRRAARLVHLHRPGEPHLDLDHVADGVGLVRPVTVRVARRRPRKRDAAHRRLRPRPVHLVQRVGRQRVVGQRGVVARRVLERAAVERHRARRHRHPRRCPSRPTPPCSRTLASPSQCPRRTTPGACSYPPGAPATACRPVASTVTASENVTDTSMASPTR